MNQKENCHDCLLKEMISEEKFKLFADNYPDPMARYNTEGRISYFNKSLQQALNVKMEDIYGKLSTEFWQDGRFEGYEQKIINCLATGESQKYNLDGFDPDGEESHHIIQFFAEKDKHGHISGVISFCVDVSDKILLQVQIEKSARLAAIGQVVGDIAHEINTPLTLLSWECDEALELLNGGQLTDEIFKSFIDKVNRNVNRINKIVNSSRKAMRTGEDDEPKNENIVNLINNALDLCDHKIKMGAIKLKKNFNENELIEVNCRGIQIEQVLTNLINNACDAISHQNKAWIEVAILEDEKFIEISVTDSGNGIPPEIQRKMNKPFFTTKSPDKGTGLGLTISRRIIDEHRGSLYIDSQSTNTKFVIRLPKTKCIF